MIFYFQIQPRRACAKDQYATYGRSISIFCSAQTHSSFLVQEYHRCPLRTSGIHLVFDLDVRLVLKSDSQGRGKEAARARVLLWHHWRARRRRRNEATHGEWSEVFSGGRGSESSLYQAVLDRKRGGLGTVGGAKLCEDIAHMEPGRSLANHEHFGDLGIAASFYEQLEHLDLTIR